MTSNQTSLSKCAGQVGCDQFQYISLVLMQVLWHSDRFHQFYLVPPQFYQAFVL